MALQEEKASRARLDRLIGLMDPGFRPRWEVYNELLEANLSPDEVWIDIGCGTNEFVAEYRHGSAFAVGVDLEDRASSPDAPLVVGDACRLPFRDGCAGLATLYFVLEHLRDVAEAFGDIERVLKPDGRVLICTTNVWCPLVCLPKLLPFRLKNLIIQRLYGVSDQDVFPTYHRLNKPGKLRRGLGSLELVHLDLVQDVTYSPGLLFLVLLAWDVLTKPRPLRVLRSTMVAVFRKGPTA